MNNAIDKIEQFQRFGSVLGLERISSLLELLGNPQDELKCIHIAGTNGKGSICKYLYESLRQAGYSVGLYTSPFLEVFNERIELDGKYITDEELEKYTSIVLEKVKVLTDKGEDSPTEFEVITAIAFLYFKEKNVDYVVLEVGLGGRGDSTNVIKKPLASVIASISFDHTDRLGNTLSEIAFEKAGIIKAGCPVITSAKSEEALNVFREKVKKLGSEYYETKDIPFKVIKQGINGTEFSINNNTFMLTMLGNHQIENAICAIKTLYVLREEGMIKISDEEIYEGIKRAKQIGRFEIFENVILDGAHNPDGARTLKETVLNILPNKKILMIIGMLKDKDVSNAIKSFSDIATDFIATEPPNDRRMKADELGNILSSFGNTIAAFPEYKDATLFALSKKNEYDYILFAGSLYLIGAVRKIVKNN